MYAIIADSGRQFKVEEGQELAIDYREASAGEVLTFDRVLTIRDEATTTLGHPTIEGATVTAEIVGVTQGPKLTVQKLRRRKNSRRKTGHRQLYTKVKINKIDTGQPGTEPEPEKPEAKAEPKPDQADAKAEPKPEQADAKAETE